MSARANSSKPKAAKKSAANTVKASAPSAPKANSTSSKSPKRTVAKSKKEFYFVAGDYEPRITDKKPKPSGSVLEFSSFEEAKDQAVEQLIDLIDRCERRLWEIKRAESFEQYQQLAGSD
jgi:hypothetical protein